MRFSKIQSKIKNKLFKVATESIYKFSKLANLKNYKPQKIPEIFLIFFLAKVSSPTKMGKMFTSR